MSDRDDAIQRMRFLVAGDECARNTIVMAFARDVAALLAAYDEAVQRAEDYERDWRAAKREFGQAMARMQERLRLAAEAFRDIDAALGDRLLARGPLSRAYARAVTDKIQAARHAVESRIERPSDPDADMLVLATRLALAIEALIDIESFQQERTGNVARDALRRMEEVTS